MARVLLVDDARLFRELERSFLNRTACEVSTASGGLQALERARRLRPDAIVLDVDMPGLDGLTCCRALKSDHDLGATPVVLAGAADRRREALDAGADRFVEKPMRRETLLQALRELIDVEERGAVRRALDAIAVCIEPDGVRHPSRLKDVSLGGAFLSVSPPFEPGTRLGLELQLGDDEPMSASAEVVRKVPRDPDSHLIPGVGVRFVGLADARRRKIERLLGTEGAP